jgi:hypothetical protein
LLAEVRRLHLSTPADSAAIIRAEVTVTKVVDASALAALLFAEPAAEAIAGGLEGARLAAPSLLDVELANV